MMLLLLLLQLQDSLVQQPETVLDLREAVGVLGHLITQTVDLVFEALQQLHGLQVPGLAAALDGVDGGQAVVGGRGGHLDGIDPHLNRGHSFEAAKITITSKLLISKTTTYSPPPMVLRGAEAARDAKQRNMIDFMLLFAV